MNSGGHFTETYIQLTRQLLFHESAYGMGDQLDPHNSTAYAKTQLE